MGRESEEGILKAQCFSGGVIFLGLGESSNARAAPVRARMAMKRVRIERITILREGSFAKGACSRSWRDGRFDAHSCSSNSSRHDLFLGEAEVCMGGNIVGSVMGGTPFRGEVFG